MFRTSLAQRGMVRGGRSIQRLSTTTSNRASSQPREASKTDQNGQFLTPTASTSASIPPPTTASSTHIDFIGPYTPPHYGTQRAVARPIQEHQGQMGNFPFPGPHRPHPQTTTTSHRTTSIKHGDVIVSNQNEHQTLQSGHFHRHQPSSRHPRPSLPHTSPPQPTYPHHRPYMTSTHYHPATTTQARRRFQTIATSSLATRTPNPLTSPLHPNHPTHNHGTISRLQSSLTPTRQPTQTVIRDQRRTFYALLRPRNHARFLGLGRQINNKVSRGSYRRKKKKLRDFRYYLPVRYRIYRNRWYKMRLMFNSYNKSHTNIQDTLDTWDMVLSPQWRALRYNPFFRITRIPKPLQHYYGHRQIKWQNREFDQRVRAEARRLWDLMVVLIPRLKDAPEKYKRRQIWFKLTIAFWSCVALLMMADPGELAGGEAVAYFDAISLEFCATVFKILHQHDMFHFRTANFYNTSILTINRALGRGRTNGHTNNVEGEFKAAVDNFLNNPLTLLPGSSHRQQIHPYVIDTILHVMFARSNIQLSFTQESARDFVEEINTYHVRTMAPFKKWKANTPNALALTQDYQ